ncbi:T9SS type A sorting domain-containing protein [bacterium]|nr:T9SS type A sorting domain-containing protein [bacterium]
MRSFLLLIGFLSFSIFSLAQTPTKHATGLNVIADGCSAIKANWIAGDGSNRILVVEEGSSATFTPDNGTVYTYGQVIGDVRIYPNTSISSTINGLNKGTLYTLYIFEFNNTVSPDYLTTSGYPSQNVTTEEIVISNNGIGNHVCEGTPISYRVQASHSTGANLTATWKLDTFTNTDTSLTYTYPSYGKFNASLNVSAPGCNESVQWIDTIAPYPIVDFIIPSDTPNNDTIQCLIDNSFFFDNKTINPYLATSTDKAIIEWKFGDGNTVNSYRSRHSYSDAGTFDVQLKVMTSKQDSEKVWCADSLTKSVRVIASPDPNDIEIKYEYLEQGDSLKFSYNQSDFNYWVMGDTIWSSDSFIEMNSLGTYNLQLVSSEICKMDWDIEVISLAPGGFLGSRVQELDQDNNDEVMFELPEAPEYLWSSGETTKTITITSQDTAVGTYQVWGESRYNPELSISDTITLNIVNTASIVDIERSNKVYPNPAQHSVSLNLAQASSYSLLDIHGNEVLGSDLKLMSHKLELDSLPQGIYFLRVNNGTKVQTIKLIKN